MEYQQIWMYIIDFVTSRLLLIFPEISGKFPEILNLNKEGEKRRRKKEEESLVKYKSADNYMLGGLINGRKKR